MSDNEKEPLQMDEVGRKASTFVQKAPKITPVVGFTLLVNVLMGTGPIYLPGKFLGDGWLFSTIFLIFVTFLSYVCFELMIEAMSNYNALLKTPRMSLCLKTDNSLKDESGNQLSLIDQISEDARDDCQNDDEEFYEGQGNLYRLQVVAELGQMCRYFWGKYMDMALTFIIIFYLVGVLVSKTIASSNILSEMFTSENQEQIPVLGYYLFWLALFSISASVLSFKDIAGIKIVQQGIVLFRFLVIILLIIGPIIYIFMGHGGGLQPINPKNQEKLTAINFSGFENFFSTAIFALLCHHSIASMMSNVQPAVQIRKVGLVAFFSGGGLFIAISILGIIAFQGDMMLKDNFSTYTNVFRGKLDVIYYITSFYMFLNIAAFPILIITMRNNIMKCFIPDKIPKVSHQITMHTLIITICLITPIILLSIFAKDNIETVINISGGIFGVIIMMILPSILTIKTRQKLALRSINYQLNPHVCTIKGIWMPWVVFVIGIACLIFNITQDIIQAGK